MVMDREERRKRIMERGNDRLALITGQIHNFDPSSPSASSAASSAASSSTASHNRTFSEAFLPQSTQFERHPLQESPSLKYQYREEIKVEEEPKPSTIIHKAIESKPTKPEVTRPIKSKQRQSQQSQQTKSFLISPKKLNASIISSERTRNLSSLTIAAFVVLLPRLNIMRSETIVFLRPLWLLILTDCAIVMSHLMETSGGGLSNEMEGNTDGNNGANWSDAEKLLERGLVLYQALRGMFIDCSLYMVVVICSAFLL